MKPKNSRSPRCDVAIIGGGPSGLFLASLLGEKGFSVALFERKKDVATGIACAGVVSKDLFAQFDLPENLIVREINEVEVSLESRKNYTISISNSPGVLLDRGGLNSHLLSQAKKVGVKVIHAARVEGIEEDRAFVKVKYIKDRIPQELRCRLAFIATGSDNILTYRAGLQPPPVQFTGFHSIYRREKEAEVPSKTVIYYFPSLLGSGFGWEIPDRDNLSRVGIFVPGNAPLSLFKEFARKLSLNGNWTLAPMKRRINQGLAQKIASSRIALIGEAAGAVKTTTGGGIAFGMKSALLAFEAASQYFTRSKPLEKFDEVLRKEFSSEISAGVKMRKIVSSLSIDDVERIADFITKNGVFSLLQTSFRFDSHERVISLFTKSLTLIAGRISRDS